MGSTFPSKTQPADSESGTVAPLRWRNWPLADQRPWSWLAPAAVLGVGGIAAYLSSCWLMGLAAAAGLSATLWQFLLPVAYEIHSLGVRRQALGRTRLVPWHAIRSYQPRTTGVVLYQRSDPTKVDLLRSMFVPYPTDEDEMLCALRQHLQHAVELPP